MGYQTRKSLIKTRITSYWPIPYSQQAFLKRPVIIQFTVKIDNFFLTRTLKKISNYLMILPQVHLRKPCYDFYFL